MVANKQSEEALEYQRNLLGFLWDATKTVGIGGILLGLAGFIAYKVMGKEGVQNNFGLQGMYMVNAIGSIFSDNPVFSEAELEAAFMASESLETLIKTQLSGSDIIIGDETMKTLLSPENRKITLALLKQEGFSLNDPTTLDMNLVQKALLKAATLSKDDTLTVTMQGTAESFNFTALNTYRDAVIQSMLTDKSGNAADKIGLIRKGIDAIESLAGDEKPNYAFLGENAALFLANDTNRNALVDFLENIKDEDLNAVINTLLPSEEGQKAGIESLLKNEALMASLMQPENIAAFKSFLTAIDKEGIPEAQREQFDMARKFLLASSDVEGKLNLDIIAGLSADPDARSALNKIIEGMASGNIKTMNDINLEADLARRVFSTFQQLDFGRTELVAQLTNSENEEIQAIGSKLNLAKLAIDGAKLNGDTGLKYAMNSLNSDTLALNQNVIEHIEQNEKDDSLDVLLNVAVGTALKVAPAARGQ